VEASFELIAAGVIVPLLPYFEWRLIGGLIAFAGGLLIVYVLVLISKK